MKKSKILTILMVLVLMVSLVACSTTKNNDKSKSNNTADISSLMKSEPSDLEGATALYQKLMQMKFYQVIHSFGKKCLCQQIRIVLRLKTEQIMATFCSILLKTVKITLLQMS